MNAATFGAAYATAAATSRHPLALYAEGAGSDKGHGERPRQSPGRPGAEEANGQAGLEDDWRDWVDRARLDRTHHDPGNQNPRLRSPLIRREKVLIALGVIAALVWGSLFGQILS